MILVIGESNDVTCNIVSEYLYYLGANFKRVNGEDFTILESFHLGNQKKTQLTTGNERIPQDIRIVWHRRGTPRLMPLELRNSAYNVYGYLKKEEESILKSLEERFKTETKYIGSYFDEIENYKIQYLEIAMKAGLQIPETLITSSKKTLKKFLEQEVHVICKDIRYPIHLYEGKKVWSSGGTFKLTTQILNEMQDYFFPSLFQKMIFKEYEIRIFFFLDELFSMAIFSQADEKTRIDYRNYNVKKPNRNVPFQLPAEMDRKIRNFIKISKLTSGSIDLIVSPEQEYYFLEHNPQGQMDW